MHTIVKSYCLVVLLLVLLARVSASEGGHASSAQGEGLPLVVRVFFRPLPDAMPGSEDDTPARIALGRRLYFERAVSINGKQSCNDCHRIDQRKAGVDNLPVSKGAKGSQGKRNSPTVLNAGFQVAQFWDGRAADLEEQAKGPPLNPIEMGMTSAGEVVRRLKGVESYRREFHAAFPDTDEPVTFDNFARAVAAFERTLVAPSRFDRYLKGDMNALAADEMHGLHRFVETGCIDCHSGRLVGGNIYERIGLNHAYENRKDPGRYKVTRQRDDRFVFKVPMLRNVTLTAPYFHDGRVAELREAVRRMAWMQLDKALGPAEINEILAFLGALEAERLPDISAP